MTTREWGTIAGWGVAISLVLVFTVGYASEALAKFFMITAFLSSVAWSGLGVRASIEGYVSPADRDLDARLQADTRAAYQRDLEEGKWR